MTKYYVLYFLQKYHSELRKKQEPMKVRVYFCKEPDIQSVIYINGIFANCVNNVYMRPLKPFLSAIYMLYSTQ